MDRYVRIEGREDMGIGLGMIGAGGLLISIGAIRLVVFLITSEKKKKQMEWKMNERY